MCDKNRFCAEVEDLRREKGELDEMNCEMQIELMNQGIFFANTDEELTQLQRWYDEDQEEKRGKGEVEKLK